jgi:ParB family chromosome partitioning protein
MTTATSPPETVVELPVESLLPSEHNQRLKLRGLEELAASIKQHGVLEPLLVTANGNNSHHLVSGHRRLAAAKMAGRKTVPCIVRAYPEEGGLLMAMLVANLQRDDLSPLEEAKGYQQLADMRQSQRDIARLVGRSQPHVNKRLGLLKLSPGALAQFEAGKVPLDDVALLAALPAERQDRVLHQTNHWGGSIAQCIHELEWKDKEAKRHAEEAKKPKPKVVLEQERIGDRTRAADRKKEKLRKEANEARAKLLPRLLSRGERELQYAAGVIAESTATIPCHRAAELLKLKQARGPYGPSWTAALFAHAAKSKKAAVDVIVALALSEAEERIRGTYVGGSPLSMLHIGALQKVGYKPNARDQALLKKARR